MTATSYYELTTDNLEVGWGPRFHFAPFPDPKEGVQSAINRHDHYLACFLGLRPGMRGLDAGCGTGGATRELAFFMPGVHITGITNCATHVERAQYYAKRDGLEDYLDYVEGDFMSLPFPDNSFDFVYAQEATVYAPCLADCYTEIARVLKPGGRFGVYEWLMQEGFDPLNEKHVEIRQQIERGDGITNLLTVAEGLEAVKTAGLVLEHYEDRSLVGAEKKTWYCVLEGDTSQTTNWEDWWLVMRLQRWWWNFGLWMCWFLEPLGLLRKGRYEALWTQGMSVWSMLDGAREGIWTPMYMMVGRKPEDWKHPKADGSRKKASG